MAPGHTGKNEPESFVRRSQRGLEALFNSERTRPLQKFPSTRLAKFVLIGFPTVVGIFSFGEPSTSTFATDRCRGTRISWITVNQFHQVNPVRRRLHKKTGTGSGSRWTQRKKTGNGPWSASSPQLARCLLLESTNIDIGTLYPGRHRNVE